jgi:hypothetical protein
MSRAISLPLGCFNPKTLQIAQPPLAGVKTKCFSDADPMNPKTKLEQKSKENTYFQGVEVELKYWNSESSILKPPYFHPTNSNIQPSQANSKIRRSVRKS